MIDAYIELVCGPLRVFPSIHVLLSLWLSSAVEVVKATVLAESSSSINFYRDLSAPVMSTDMSQVGVALFPSF